MNNNELDKLRDALKKKWNEVNAVYQKDTHISKVDTLGMKRRKEDCEAKLE